MWVKFYKRTINVVAKHRAFHLDKKKQNPDYYPTYNIYGFPLAFKDLNPNLELYATSVEQQTKWFKASIEYIHGLVDLDLNVFEDDIGSDVLNNSFDLDDNAVLGNRNNDVLLLEGGDGFVDSVGGDKNHKCNKDKQDQQDKQPSLADVLYELRALRKEVALVKVDDARIAKLERILNDNFIPCNDRSKGNHNAVNPGLTTSANYPLSTCSRYVDDNPEVACAGTGVHNPPRNNDSRNSNHNAVNTGLSSANDHMLSCFSLEMPNDEVAVPGTAIHNADEMCDSPNCVTDNDVKEIIGSNTSCPEMHNDEVLVAANDNDVNQETDPMSACSGPDMHLAVVAVAGMKIDKGDGHIDILTTSDNDVNLAKSDSVNDPRVLVPNAEYEGNVVSAKEVELDVIIQVAYDGIDFLQHDDHVDCFVAKSNDHLTTNIGVKPIHENEFVDDFMDVLKDEESLPKSDYVNVVTDYYKPCLASVSPGQKKRKKSDMKTNYILRSVKERKKRLAMALESPFSQQPPTTLVPPKRISRSVNYDFIMPPYFEEDVSGQPKNEQEKEGVDGKLASLLTTLKDLDNLIESQKSDKNKVGLGYSVVPPPIAQIYSSPKKDLSGLVSLRVKMGRSSPKNNYTHRSMPPRPAIHKPYIPPMRPVRPNIYAAQPKRTSFYKPAHSYNKRHFQEITQDLVAILIQRVQRLERELKVRTPIHKVNRGRSRPVMAWVPKKRLLSATITLSNKVKDPHLRFNKRSIHGEKMEDLGTMENIEKRIGVPNQRPPQRTST
nr:phospholipase-like protein [Tanacetum cinerariifolium]